MKEQIKEYVKTNLGIDDEETFEMIYSSFLDTVEDNLTKLGANMDASKLGELRAAAHALKGCSANIGAELFRAASYDLEMSAKSGDFAGCKAAYQKLLDNRHLL